VRARFVIDASGRAAAIARRCGARRQRDDRLVGVLGIVGPDRDAARVAGTLVETDRDGWWYAAPLGGDRVVVARMTDADLAQAGGLLDPSVWLARMRRTHHIAARVGSARLAGPLAVRPSFSQSTRPLAGPGWLAAGEAAVAFDPLSGMGIGYALASGIEAARAAAACTAGRNEARAAFARAVGDHYRRYLRRRSATYAIERRWSQSPFWARRQVDAASAA
jgi:flavin-dependent dehydrogenase